MIYFYWQKNKAAYNSSKNPQALKINDSYVVYSAIIQQEVLGK